MAKKSGFTSADTKELFDNSSVIVFKCAVTDTYPITFISSNVREILGFEPAYFFSNQEGWSSRIHPEDKEKVNTQFEIILEKGGSTINEYRFRRKDGKYVWLRDEIKTKKDEEGNSTTILGACFEITDRKKSELDTQKDIEKELRKRLDYQHALSQCSNLLIDSSGFDTVEKALSILLKTTRTDRVYIFTNSKDVAGNISLSQIHEVCSEGVIPEIDNPELQNMPFDSLPWVFGQLAQNKIVDIPIRRLPSPEREFMADQEIKSFLLLPVFIDDDWFGFMGFDSTRFEREWQEHEIMVLKTAADIIGTYFKRKAVEESLLQQKNFTQQMLDSLPSIIVLMNKKMEFLQWNKTAEKFTGYTSKELYGKTAYDIIAPESHKNMEGALGRIVNKGETEGEELILLHKSGKKHLYFWRGEVLKMDGEAVFVIVGLNITKQKEMETELIEEKRLADAIINSLPGIFYVIDKHGNYLRVNKNFVKEFGYSERELRDMNPLKFYDEKDQNLISAKIKQVFTEGSANVELHPITKAGKKIPYYLKAIRFDRKDESFVIGTGHNISEQKQREADMQASVDEKHVLLQEIHHRVKNNLAVISGLLELQAYEFDHPEFRRLVLDSQRRIQTMAMIHEKLYQSESLSRISVLQYIDDLIKQIGSSFNIQNKKISIETNIEDTDLNINQAIPFALAINEIISNSFEHAFKGRDKGKVEVELYESAGKIYTVIKDDGVGLAEEKSQKSSSLGMTLIQALFSQIGAEWSMEGEKGGVTFSISFPKDKEKGSSSALDDL
ncbi:MAG: PAS domain S-box protein [Balneolaceae bacterium]